MKKTKKLSRYEKQKLAKEALKKRLQGTGLYEYRNNTRGDLSLPKPDINGRQIVPPGQTWKGDSYFMFLVRDTHEATLVEVLKEDNMSEEKLILDQPDQITEKGKVEHVVIQDDKKINESFPKKEEKKKDTLINENPLDGVEIILND